MAVFRTGAGVVDAILKIGELPDFVPASPKELKTKSIIKVNDAKRKGHMINITVIQKNNR